MRSNTSRALSRLNLKPRPGVDQGIGVIRGHPLHEVVGDGHGQVEVGQHRRIALGGDELQDVRVVHPEDAHVGAPAAPPLFHHCRGGVKDAHEAHGAGGHPAGAPHLVAPGAQVAEVEAGAAAGLVDQGHVPHALQDAAHVVGDGNDEAGGQLPLGQAGVHQGGGVGEKLPGGHGLIKGLGLPGRGLRAAVARFRRGHALGHPAEQFVGGLHHPALGVPAQIALGQDPGGDGAKLGRDGSRHYP